MPHVHASTRSIGVLAALMAVIIIAPVPGVSRAAGQCETWQPMASGVNGTVYAFAAYNGDLVAAGSFAMAGGLTVNNIARWDGLYWQPVAEGMSTHVSALTTYGTDLVAGGDFNNASGQLAYRIALWRCPPQSPAACAPPPDGMVNVTDLLAMLAQWEGDGNCDVNGDGLVNVTDLLLMLAAWGPC